MSEVLEDSENKAIDPATRAQIIAEYREEKRKEQCKHCRAGLPQLDPEHAPTRGHLDTISSGLVHEIKERGEKPYFDYCYAGDV